MNIEKLDEAIAYIEAHPEEHDQGAYFCDTTACIAGTAALLAGWKPVRDREFGGDSGDVVRGDERNHAYDVARALFGLTDDQAYDLFLEANNLDDIKRFRIQFLADEVRESS